MKTIKLFNGRGCLARLRINRIYDDLWRGLGDVSTNGGPGEALECRKILGKWYGRVWSNKAGAKQP